MHVCQILGARGFVQRGIGEPLASDQRDEGQPCQQKRSAHGKELEESKRRQAVLDQGVTGDEVAGARDQREVAAQPRAQRKRQEQA